MPKTNLLNTRTTNFVELIGNGKVYRVPPYQRDYSWKEEHWEDLWNDVVAMIHDKDDIHYMGALVVEGKSDREFLVIDGQQRIATLSILALAVIRQLTVLKEGGVDTDDNAKRIEALRARFVGETDPASLIYSSKLFLNASNNDFYQDYLVQLREPLTPKRLPISNRLLWEAYTYFGRKISESEDIANTGQALATLLNETVARQLLFILIVVEDELNAYTVFETLNARGLELSATDLLKNYLFSRVAGAQHLEALQRRWQQIILTVGQEKFPEFLRYYLMCSHRQVRRQRLFKMMRDTVKTDVQVFALIEELARYAELFAALSDQHHQYWQGNRDQKQHVRDLALFRVRQIYPVLFAAYYKFDQYDFTRLLKLAVAVSFRYSIVCGLNTNELEPVYHAAAKGIMDGALCSVKQVFETLRPVYITDIKFKQDFALAKLETSGQGKKLVKYVLCRLEEKLSGRECNFETDPATVEHILPENPPSLWDEAFPGDMLMQYVYRLGNLTLLEFKQNKSAGTRCFVEKKAIYRSSGYRMAQTIDVDEWLPATIEQRQSLMADLAAQIWRADFS